MRRVWPLSLSVMGVSVEAFRAEHLPEVLSLCDSEGWPSLPSDPARAQRVLTAPGVTTVVAVTEGAVVGFAQLLSDGEIQAYLATLVVLPEHRGRGIGTGLIEAGLARAGGRRVDLLTETADDFYQGLRSKRMTGFRVYPREDLTAP